MHICLAVWLLAVGAGEATAEEFLAQAKRLGASQPRGVRFEAVRWLNAHYSDDAAGKPVIRALEQAASDEPDVEIRGRAIVTLGLMAHHQKLPCPLVLLRAMSDKDEEVRSHAGSVVALFTQYAPGAAEVLVKGAQSADPGIRTNCLYVLGPAAGKDEAALKAIEAAKTDKSFDVRRAAHVAAFRSSDKLEVFLRYLIRVREEPDWALAPLPEDKELRERERVERNLALLSAPMFYIRWREQRPEEFGSALLGLLDDKSPALRRGAAGIIGASVVKIELPDDKKGKLGADDITRFLPPDNGLSNLFPREPPKKKPLEKSKVALYLEKKKVQERLREMSEKDADASVRAAAKEALGRWQAFDKKP